MRILKIIFIVFLFLLSSNLFANSTTNTNNNFEQYKQKQNNKFKMYKKNLNNDFTKYKKAYALAFKAYKKSILKKWNKAEFSTPSKWVSYGKFYNSKQVVDFKNQKITFEVFAKNKKEAIKRFQAMQKQLLKANIKNSFQNDHFEQNLSKITKENNTPNSKMKILASILPKNYLENALKTLSKESKINKISKNSEIKVFEKDKQKAKNTYKIVLQFPKNSLLKSAKIYKKLVLKNSSKNSIPPALSYAIIECESYFNPLARSNIPAFGLMQIVPESAGLDTYRYFFGKARLLSPAYLYEPKNNIFIGVGYLHIIYFKYMKNIKNPLSRIYCTICAYNTGSGNVAKAFEGDNNIYKASFKINTMSPKEVYFYLLKHLKYQETKTYLKKVRKRMFFYQSILGISL